MPLSPSYQRSRQLLATPLSQVRGVGPRVLEKLAKIGLATVEDALYTLPFRYEDRREIRKIAQLRPGEQEVFFGEIIASGESQTARSRKRLYEAVVSDGTGSIALKWFHYRKDWMKKRFAVGARAFFVGEVKRFGAIREVHHPEAEFVEGEASMDQLVAADPLSFGRILPVYPLTEGLHQKAARKIFKDVVERFAPTAISPIPAAILQRRCLMPLAQAFQQAHWPDNQAHLQDLAAGRDPARRALVFDEFFFLELGLALKRRGVVLEEGIPFEVAHRYTKPLAKLLPYTLTDAQRRVLGEIKRDLMAPHPMHRLVQGDVGSGKTIVALMAALVAIENHTQVAVVAPTEILAEQHYLQFHHWLGQLGLKAALLSGGTGAKEKRAILEEIREGRVDLVVGTHAVLQEGVEFKRLGLGIIDEQHRFGVRQRGVLRKKGSNPHILVMTATPIPRTLSLTLYGDLALSIIDELPPGRSPIKTRAFPDPNRSRAYEVIRHELEAGRQAYIVYPLVEESEKTDLLAASEGAEYLQQKVFPGHRVGLLHGRMKPNEKEAIMADFKARGIDILVSTTVIEVGIDVPNATVMMVEHAERFGLAQLHQLRGRVGRGSHQGYCLLIRSQRCSEEGMRRIQVMCETTDGFKIAEADLEIRGPGEFLGTRQAGVPDFRVADLLRDGRVLEEAREEAFLLAEDPDFLSGEQYAELRSALMERWGSRLELASIG
ncbi:ATP-dependent DNA helicase RecG [Desulfuromonas versatilis]|uniref:ATP-dependent DNA helicase RecG n=1 Tax=Desulfuromonas versatilis TaxID=2802975 RepID=A0ABN6DY30_9BACT|nr:ATP-dependent DNA helicase RecG [Desulfuromonas versatilis]BCR05000.1 ATP-dependent DNA helicase RecG [Desulfuromonas versatilis]